MRRVLLLNLTALLLLAGSSHAGVIVVDQGGSGDYDNIPEAALNGTADDTVLVWPGVYPVVAPAWPITLHIDSPAFMSDAGAQVTILEGDHSVPAFHVPNAEFQARTTVVGFTIRNTAAPVLKEFECGGPLQFTDNIVEFNDQGLDAQQGGAGSIARNVIRNNASFGINMWHFGGVIEDNEICYNDGDGISGICCEEPTIQHNYIHHNGESGIDPSFYCYANDNIIDENEAAGVEVYSHAELDHNMIRGNLVGVRIWWEPDGSMDHNDVSGNLTYAVQVLGSKSGRVNYLARYCWWGENDGDFIAQSIWDSSDDPELTTSITYWPWCHNPGCVVPVEAKSWGSIKALYR